MLWTTATGRKDIKKLFFAYPTMPCLRLYELHTVNHISLKENRRKLWYIRNIRILVHLIFIRPLKGHGVTLRVQVPLRHHLKLIMGTWPIFNFS